MVKKSKLKRDEFFKAHPFCCYCGGSNRATTLDHAPPITMFRERLRPKGLEVPACRPCNEKFSPYDDFFAGFAQMMADGVSANAESTIPIKKLSGMLKRFPNAFPTKNLDNEHALYSNDGVIFEGVKARVSDDVNFIVNYFTARLGVAVYYSELNKPLPIGAIIQTLWQSNIQQLNHGLPPSVVDLISNAKTLSQGRWEVPDQFEYGYNLDDATGLGITIFNFHLCFSGIAIVYCFDKPEKVGKRHGLFQITNEGIQPLNMRPPLRRKRV